MAVIRRGNRILIAQRPFEKFLGGLWELPGGKREPGETLEEACEREVLEETGLNVEAGHLIAKVKHAYSHFRITMYAFECKESKKRAAAKALDGHLQVKWVRMADLNGYAFPRANSLVMRQFKA